MFAKIALLFLLAFFASPSQAQYVLPAAYPAVYSPYAYGGVYSGYAAAYPAYYGWGSDKGGAAAAAPTGKLTNNQ